MNIQIKRNTFVEPTQPRQRIVQGICNVIMYKITNNSDGFCELYVKGEFPKLFYGDYTGNYPRDWSPYRITGEISDRSYTYTRIRSCEMRLAFRHLQSAGYYIFDDANQLRYIISARPYYCQRKAEYTEFCHHID